MSLAYCLSQLALVNASVSSLRIGAVHTKGDVVRLVIRKLSVAAIPIEHIAGLCSKTKLAPPQCDMRVFPVMSSLLREVK